MLPSGMTPTESLAILGVSVHVRADVSPLGRFGWRGAGPYRYPSLAGQSPAGGLTKMDEIRLIFCIKILGWGMQAAW